MTAPSNLWPRFSALAGESGKISNVYRAWFSRFKERIGPAIANVLDVSPAEDQARAINEILAEIRAQNWILPQSSGQIAALSGDISAVTMIPAATEFGYGTRQIRKAFDFFSSFSLNARYEAEEYGDGPLSPEGIYLGDNTDFEVSVADLKDKAPNCAAVSLFVTWFGDDLRAQHCTVKPKVETQLVDPSVEAYGYPNPGDPLAGMPLIPHDWRVQGRNRIDAETVSTKPPSGNPAFGGTPSDDTIIEAITHLHSQGFEVSFTPFLLMDIPSSNSLPNPYDGTPSQPIYPWRGRITCDPAPGVPGTPDKTSAAAAQVTAFVGTATPSDFFTSGGEVFYSGPDEWSYRRFILHYAHLCAIAGGIDVFVIGSEMRGLTWVRDSVESHPFVDALVALAADVKTILPDARVIYAADWSEYHSYQPPDGSGDLIFHLDPLWSSADIDAIGIDCYFPLSDWRDGTTHLDYLAGFTSIYDTAYLRGNVFGGEGYDWYYASSSDRDAQIRTDITDGAYDKPWVFRYKDLPNWWSNHHVNRIGGVETGSATAWQPKSKPIWFTEMGCPAVDKGANQPNVFFDPGSFESAFPYYSTGERDDTIQKRYIQAFLSHFDETNATFKEENNPASDVYAGRMIDTTRLYLYTWDARPYPVFPESTFWSDRSNYPFGHWLTGRVTALAATQAGNGMALREVLAPQDPFLTDPTTKKLNKRWRDFFDGLGFIQGEAIDNVPDQPSAAEIATAINAILGMLRNQRRIGA